MRWILTIFSFILANASLSFAQIVDYREHRIDQFGISSGMSSNNVLHIIQDQYGFIWAATAEGLNRFDGKNFTIYDKGKSNISLSNNYTQFLTKSKNGNIWVATSNGLNIYNYKGDSIQKIFENSSKSSISSNDIICFAETSNGIWIATYDKGINFYDYKEKIFTRLALPDIFKHIYITYIFADRDNNLWIGTLTDGLYCYSLSKQNLTFYQTPRVQEIIQDSHGTVWIAADDIFFFSPQTQTFENLKLENTGNTMQITRMEEDNTGMMWVGSVVGLGYFNLKDFYQSRKAFFVEVRQKGKNFNIPFRAVNCIKVDKDNNIWIGTFGDGLSMIHGEKDKFGHLSHNILDNSSISSNKAASITTDGNGTYFVATDGNGIDVLNSSLKKVRNYTINNDNNKELNSNNVFHILYDSNGNLWSGGFGLNILRSGASSFNSYKYKEEATKENIVPNNVRMIVEAADKSIWIGTDMGLIHYKDNKFSNEFYRLTKRRIDVRAIASDKDQLWLGTYGDGLISYNIQSNKIDYYFNYKNFDRNYIHALKKYGDTLCISTQGDGILLFSLKNKTFFGSYNKSNGLKSNYIQALEIDKYGRIWAASNQGITCISRNKIQHFDTKEGISKNEFSNSMKNSISGNSETIFFCGNDGVFYFNPDDLPKYKASSKILFNSLKIFNQSIRPSLNDKNCPLKENIIMTKKIELQNNQSFFSVGFINIDYNYAQHIQYYYKLKGIDKEWNKVEQQEITFRNLPSGKYTLMVKASSFDDDNNDNVSEIEIVIHPPFWETSQAFLIYFILLCLALYAIWKFSTIKMQAKHRINLEKSERQRDEEIHQAKLRFFTNISHELRTPLTLIIGPLESMTQKYPLLKKEISVISQNAQKLLLLVNQLLDFRKNEMNEMKLKVKYACLTSQIHQIVASFDGLRIEKKMNLTLTSSPLELHGWYDTDFVEKIMFNLLSNAYKFTQEEGKISIEILKLENNNQTWAQIKVLDNGCGIDNKEIDLIFNRFYQSEQSNISKKGTGIGLNLVKSLVELHHGEIKVESAINKGSGFIVEIPIDKEYYTKSELKLSLYPTEVEEENIELDNSDVTEAIDSKKDGILENEKKNNINILVVDDEIGICEYIKQILPKQYHVIFASNGKEALSIINQQDFDVVISDIMMPEMDGITLCDKIKKNIETSHIPVILLTAKSSIENKLEGLKIGADSYISKPFHPAHLQIRVEKLIESRQMFKKKFEKTFSFEMQHIKSPSFDDILLEKVLKYINKHISEPELNGDKIAKDLNISRMTLHRKLKLLIGQTISELIRGIRLKEAAYQIENTNKNISDICYQVGFNSPSYFTSCFVEQYGMTPTEYFKLKRK